MYLFYCYLQQGFQIVISLYVMLYGLNLTKWLSRDYVHSEMSQNEYR